MGVSVNVYETLLDIFSAWRILDVTLVTMVIVSCHSFVEL